MRPSRARMPALMLGLLLAAGLVGGCNQDGTLANDGRSSTSDDEDAGWRTDAAGTEGRPDGAAIVDGESSSDGSGTSSNDAETTDDEDVDEGCTQGVACGDTCCQPGQTCVEETCRAPCSGQRCGPNKSICCTGKDVCLGNKCVTPGESCERTEECPVNHICEPTLDRCIPRDSVNVCQYKPPTGEFTPVRDCRWKPAQSDSKPGRGEVEAAPVVANVTDDNGDGKTNTEDIPEIIFLSDNHDKRGCCSNPSTIRIVSGKCNRDGSMTTLGSISTPVAESSGGLAVGDLNDDGVPEIVAIGRYKGSAQGVIAWKRTSPDGSQWTKMWANKKYPKWDVHTRGGALASIADLEADGKPEVIVGNVVLNGQNGKLKWDGLETSNGEGGIGNNAFLGPSSSVADVDLDGNREVAAGNTLYDHDGSVLWTYDYQEKNSICGGNLPCDGFTGFANFDNDPEGEVVIVRLGIVYVLNHDGTLYWKQEILKDDCRENESGPPTVADFDGDGDPEIGTAAADFYTVLDKECEGPNRPDKCRQEGILWATPNEDCTSRVTASSVFDFEGDGRAEMVYADEENFYILDGKTGKKLYTDSEHGSNTRIEMPVVADVDNDGNSEVVVPAPYEPNDGISVWADKDDNWVRTRRIWNQHAYSVTNVEEDGSIPAQPRPNWQNGRLNNFRQNIQPGGVFDAPDLTIADLSIGGTNCLKSRSISIEVTVKNKGALGVQQNIPVDVFAIASNGKRKKLARKSTSKRLLPGQTESMRVTWTIPSSFRSASSLELKAVVDPKQPNDPRGRVNECREQNNAKTIDASSLSGGRPPLAIRSFTVDDARCNSSREVSATVKVENRINATIPAGVPIVLKAIASGTSTRSIETVETSNALSAGASASFDVDWRVPAPFLNEQFEIVAEVDPNETAFDCESIARKKGQAQCFIGG